MVDFAGFALPVYYTGILEEHAAVREAAGLFDVSHMGRFELSGSKAFASGDRLLSRPVSDLEPDQVRYALLCNESGGVVDDVTAYRRGEDRLFLCVNAANREKDMAWIRAHMLPGCEARDESDATALLALQGPASAPLLEKLGAGDTLPRKRFRTSHAQLAGRRVWLSRTGYTGADGFEIYCDAADAELIFDALLLQGEPLGCRPCGLGARDTLRLEAALPLYGHELDDSTSPLEAGLDRFVAQDGDFIGADAIRARARAGHPRALTGFVLDDRGVARAEYPVAHGGQEVGRVTSGGPSPTLGRSIGLAYVPPPLAAPDVQIEILVRGRAIRGHTVTTPFVRGARAGRTRPS
jgi:aminomethyltransferase